MGEYLEHTIPKKLGSFCQKHMWAPKVAHRELASFCRIQHRPRTGFVLPITATLGAGFASFRFPDYLFSSRSINRWFRIRVFRFRLITTLHSNVKARNASRAAYPSPRRNGIASARWADTGRSPARSHVGAGERPWGRKSRLENHYGHAVFLPADQGPPSGLDVSV